LALLINVYPTDGRNEGLFKMEGMGGAG